MREMGRDEMRGKGKTFWRRIRWGRLFGAVACLCALSGAAYCLGKIAGRSGGWIALLALLCVEAASLAALCRRRRARRESERRRREQKEAECRVFYNEDELTAVNAYLAEAFGKTAYRFYDADTREMRIDIVAVCPTRDRNFYTLSTVGMGAHRMSVPPMFAEKNRAFAELTMLLPPDWDLMKDTWPFQVLKEAARRPFAASEHLCLGSAYRGAFMNDTGFCGVLVGPALTRCETTRVMLPGGKIVNFYMLLPLYPDEWDYAERAGAFRLWERYAKRFSGDFAVRRKRSSCVGKRWFEEDISPFTWKKTADGFELALDDVSWRAEIIEQHGYPANGHGWQEIAERFASFAGKNTLMKFDGTETRFAARCRDEETLRAFALAFRLICGDDGALDQMLKEDD